MSAFCKSCKGDEAVPAFYVNDTEHSVRFELQRCLCVGGPETRRGEGLHTGERKVNEEEYERLKIAFKTPLVPTNLPFQAAA